MQFDLLEAQACADWTSSQFCCGPAPAPSNASRLPRHCRRSIREKGPARCGAFLFQPPRARADGVSVDPLGSCAMGSSVFPEMFLGMVAIGPVGPTVTPVVRPGIRAEGVSVDPLG